MAGRGAFPPSWPAPVPAIYRGRVLVLMAGTVAGHDVRKAIPSHIQGNFA
jgi:hypothetical protein